MFSEKALALTTACLLAASPFSGKGKQQNNILDMSSFAANYGVQLAKDNDIRELIAQKTGVRVFEHWLAPDELPSDAINSIIASGKAPDFIDGGDGTQMLYDAGMLVAWDEYLAKPEYSNLKEMYSDKEWDMFRQSDGKIYWANQFNNSFNGIPANRYYNDYAFWIQVRVLEWAGYPVIETLDEYFDLLVRYTQAHPKNEDGSNVITYTVLSEDWRYFCLESAGQYLDGYPNDGCVIVKDPATNPTVVDYNNTPTTKRYLQKLNSIFHTGMLDPEFAVQTYDEYIDKLASGAVLGMSDTWWDFAMINDRLAGQGLDKQGCNYVPLGLTIDNGMTNQYYTGSHETLDEYNIYTGIAVTTSCPDPDLAFRFLNRLLDQDIHDLRFWGVKGTDYLADGNGVYYRTAEMREKWESQDYLTSHACEYTYFPQYGGMSRDGINPMKPEDSDSEFYFGMAEPLKKCFEAYGFTSYWQFLRTEPNQPIYPWFPLLRVSNNLHADTEEGISFLRMTDCKQEYLPKLVASDNFESTWNDYQKAYKACKPEIFLDFMQKVVDSYKGEKPVTPTPTPAPDPGEEHSVGEFVERLYTIALGRPAEQAGKAYWVKEIEDGNRTGGDCAHFFLIEAEEFRNRNLTNEEFVETLYATFFDRASEPAGKEYWVGQLKNGAMTRDQVIMGFIDSKEWCNVCAKYGVKSGAPNAKAEIASKSALSFATRLYICCLGRAPEQGGLDYWALALTNLEQTGCSAAKEFFTSAEFVNLKLQDDAYIERLYTTFMDRQPEASEIAYWAGEIKKGTQTRASVLAFFGSSEEFTNICKKYGIDRGTI
ncbi:MAG: DUF4214 domain-containing protein [Clostridiales bacterium]|nr:DUF4214 domain-containing protein [Clostridiales bacterium]